jgi:hypothetical protein
MRRRSRSFATTEFWFSQSMWGLAALGPAPLDLRGRTVAFRAREHDQIVPGFGRVEQCPADWWAGAVASIRDLLDAVEGGAQRVVAVCRPRPDARNRADRRRGELVLDSAKPLKRSLARRRCSCRRIASFPADPPARPPCAYLFNARADAWSRSWRGGSASIRSCCHPFNTHRRSSA